MLTIKFASRSDFVRLYRCCTVFGPAFRCSKHGGRLKRLTMRTSCCIKSCLRFLLYYCFATRNLGFTFDLRTCVFCYHQLPPRTVVSIVTMSQPSDKQVRSGGNRNNAPPPRGPALGRGNEGRGGRSDGGDRNLGSSAASRSALPLSA